MIPVGMSVSMAGKVEGAYVDGQRIQVSNVQQMEDAFLVVELPYNSCQYARTGEHLIHNLYGKVGGIRMTGSAALAICYVAAGRFDARRKLSSANGIIRLPHCWCWKPVVG